jgi:hypothetical protein
MLQWSFEKISWFFEEKNTLIVIPNNLKKHTNLQHKYTKII